jgi:CheY-like chemotaxis protein
MSDPILVLVAEDEELVRLVIVEALEDAGFEVFEAEHAEAALGVLQIHAARRWCTRQTQGELAPNPSRYAMSGWRRTESGRPAANIRFSTTTPMAASVCWAAKPRARIRGPISNL